MSLRRRDVEQWMSHRRLPEELRRYESKFESFPPFLHSFSLFLVTIVFCK